jgi:hypothetical protein
MKVFAFILSAYLLFLFAVPCCTFDNCPEDKIAQEANHEKGPVIVAVVHLFLLVRVVPVLHFHLVIIILK